MSEQGSPHISTDSSQHSTARSNSSSTSNTQSRTFKPYGYGQLFPSFSPRSSGAGDTDFDWTTAEEKILRDVAQWISPADLRRARLVCKTWYGALATLTTKAATPAETLVPQWKNQLEGMLQAFPCLHELTISSRLSSVAAQQLGVLATAKKLQVLNIPHAQALQDRSLLALQPLAPHLRELHVSGASSLGRRSLLLLSVLAHLEVLELKHCGKISWLELQQAWRAACIAYEAQAAAEAAGAAAAANPNSSGGGSGSSRFSSSGGGFGSKLGAWLPTGRLFRTSSPSSNSIQSALAWQRGGSSSLFAKVHDFARGTSSAAAVAVAQLGIGAVGNGRSSCGGSMSEAPARSLLYRKQKEGAAAASGNELPLTEDAILETDALRFASTGCFPVRNGLLRMMARSSSQTGQDEESPRPVSMLSRVGSLVWHNTSAVSAGTGGSSFLGSGPSLAAQASSVQAALLAYIAQEEQSAAAGAAGAAELLAAQPSAAAAASVDAAARVRREAPVRVDGSTTTSSTRSLGGKPSTASDPLMVKARADTAVTNRSQQAPAGSESAGGEPSSIAARNSPHPAPRAAPIVGSPAVYKPRRRTTGDRVLPAMPFTKLASLSFTCTEATLRSPGPELAAVAALTSLTALEISKCKLPDAVFVHLQSLSRLNKLKLTGLWSLGDAGLQHIAQLTTLSSLALSEAMHVTAQGLQVLSGLSSLTSLALGFTQDLGPSSLARVVCNLPKLQCLEVAAPSWSDLDCEMLAEAAIGPPQAVDAANSAANASTASLADAINAGAPCASAAAAASTAPQMFWDLAGASFSRGSNSRANSSRQLLPSAARDNSSWSLRTPSFSRIRSHSFGSFSLPAAGQHVARAALLAQPLLVLRLHGCRTLTSRGMAALKQLPELHTLVLENSKEVRAAEVISQGLLPLKLASLTLRGLPFGNLFSGCVSMPCCSTRLIKLELISLEGVHEGQLRRLLSFFPNVAELSLSNCTDIEDAAVLHLALLPKLQQLSLSGCSIAGHSLAQLQQLPKLRILSLRGCNQLCDAGLLQVMRFPALEELDVAECGGVSEQALLDVAGGVQRLVRLDVSGCRGVSRGLLSSCPHYVMLRHSL